MNFDLKRLYWEVLTMGRKIKIADKVGNTFYLMVSDNHIYFPEWGDPQRTAYIHQALDQGAALYSIHPEVKVPE